jgi:hypothetical protein
MGNQPSILGWVWFAGGLWKARNKMAIEKKVVKSPRVLIFNVIAFMQQWMILAPEGERKLVEMAIKRIRRMMRSRH